MWNLKTLRDERGESQEAVANELGIQQPTISACEAGTYCERNVAVIIDLAKHYHVSVDYLLGLTEVRDALTEDEIQLAYRISRLRDPEFSKHLKGLIDSHEKALRGNQN